MIKPREGYEARYRETSDARYLALAIGEAEVIGRPAPAWALAECRRFFESHQRSLNRFDDPPRRMVKYEKQDAERLAKMVTLVVDQRLAPHAAARAVLGLRPSDRRRVPDLDTGNVRRLLRLWERETTARVELPERGDSHLIAFANCRLRDPHLPTVPESKPKGTPSARPGRKRR